MNLPEVDVLMLDRAMEHPWGARFLSRILIDTNDPNACWIWLGSGTQKGYGQLYVDGRRTYSHRLALELTTGLPDGLCGCHNCPRGDNPRCCRPSHLFAGSHRDNMRDASRKGRTKTGTKCNFAKLDDAQVIEIFRRRKNGERLRSLASEFNVTPACVWMIEKGHRWSSVTSPANDNARPANVAR